MHMLRSDSPIFKSFGEVYFSTVKPKIIKAWHLHKEATLNYACIKGEVNLVLYDDRENSRTRGKYKSIILSPKEYSLITIPPLIWNGFKGLDKQESIIANCLTCHIMKEKWLDEIILINIFLMVGNKKKLLIIGYSSFFKRKTLPSLKKINNLNIVFAPSQIN